MKNLRKYIVSLIMVMFFIMTGCTSERYATGPGRVVVVHHSPRLYHARVYHPRVIVVHKPHRDHR